MLRNNLCFPYPILREKSIDFKEGYIKTNISKTTKEDCHLINIDVIINNSQIQNWLNDGIVVMGLLVEAGALKFRKLYDITKVKVVPLIWDEVYGKVELQVCIICRKDINSYYDSDFNDDFKGFDIKLKKGDLIAIGDVYEFDAILEKDVLKDVSSIFAIMESNNNLISYDDEGDQVIIYIPKEMKKDYEMLSQSKEIYSILNSIIVFPILVELVKKCIDKEDFDEYKWYITITKKIEELKKSNKSFDRNDAFKIAQLLVPSLQEIALTKIKTVVERDDEE